MANKTTEDILLELVQSMDNTMDNVIDRGWQDKLFNELSGIEDLQEYLTLTMNQDLKRYFEASTDAARNLVKGHFTFAAYMKGALLKASKFDKTVKKLQSEK